MKNAGRLALAFVGGTLVAFLYAAAILRTLPATPQDAMSAAGMALTLLWPVLIVASAIPTHIRVSAAVLAANAAVALLIGWTGP